MGQALYRKHRPKSLAEVVGQAHITDTLERAIKSGRISHAYLFTGPRGVGKTSVARILAHEINGIPYTDDSSHMDIIEIDAASNRRIDEIRELREKVYVAPTSAKYKVYIIDEVHMLTREAFNALLKTLEEPPAHAVFILATTDAHKLPETIISRTQRFSFKPVEESKVIDHLRQLAKEEKIDISDDALGLLAKYGEGSFRDSISLLDQASNHGKKIDLKTVQSMLGIPPVEALDGLLNGLRASSQEIMQRLTDMYEQGFQASTIAKQLGVRLRSSLANGNPVLTATDTLELLAKLIEVPASHDPERYLEIILLSYATAAPALQAIAKQAAAEPAKKTVSPKPVVAPQAEEVASELDDTEAIDDPATKSEPDAANSGSISSLDIWPEVLAALKKKHNTVYSIARMGQPSLTEAGTIKLAFAFAFHQKRINDAKNRKLLLDTIHEVTGQNVSIECVYDKELAVAAPAAPKVTAPDADPALSTISNIFGGGELLES